MKTSYRLSLGTVFTLSAQLALGADVYPLSESCEIALALSAAPDHLQSEAGVYVLKQAGYERVKETDNGFTCVVERNHSTSIIPICFGAASTDANLAAILDGGSQIRSGASFEEMLARRAQALAAGVYAIPGPGISYMISDFTYIFNSSANTLLDVAPHLMFHAPGLSEKDIGADNKAMMENRGLPMINEPGPHGFLVSFVENASSGADVEKACAGQLPDSSAMMSFP